MNKFGLFISDILKNRKTGYFFNEFEKLKYLSESEIREYQFNKMKILLEHAESNVPFYRIRFYENNFSPAKLQCIEDIKQLPPLTRKDLQNHFEEIIPANYKLKKLSKGSSSGSTGLPVHYLKDNMAISTGQAAHLLGWSLSGWEMGMKGLHIWGNPSTVNNEWKRWSSRIQSKIFAHQKFPAYKLTTGSKFLELYDLIKTQKYDFLDGYTNAIYLFAYFLRENNLQLNHRVKYVFPTGENLLDFQRKTIEEMIAPVYDTYGCGEINGIAYQCCKCKIYHVIDPHVYVEYGGKVDDEGSRELIITDLDNYAFPLLRYKNDDLGIPVTNRRNCSINFSQLSRICGRQSDIIKFKDGGILSVPSFFGSMLLKQISGIKQYQIEKVSDNLLYVNFVKSKDLSPQNLHKLESALEEYLGGKIQYQIRFLEKIEPSRTGKFKLLVDNTSNI